MLRNILSLVVRLLLALVLLVAVLAGGAHVFIRYRIVDMPGRSYAGIPEKPDAAILEMSGRLKKDVVHLADVIGGRSIYNPASLNEARDWIAGRFRELDLEPKFQRYLLEPEEGIRAVSERNKTREAHGWTSFWPDYPHSEPVELANVWVEFEGREFPDQLLVVGAHYDTVTADCPGADDNGSGVAGLLELAGHLKAQPPKLSVCLVAFTCEEYPIGGIEKMGSAVFSGALLERGDKRPVGMISLEMLGYYSSRPGSQQYPPPFNLYFPDTADFIGFVGDATSRDFIRSIVRQFREVPALIPSEGVAAPVWLVPDVMRSDHAPFVERGIPALMVTDTSNFRYEHYHRPTDTPERLDFIRMAYVVDGLGRAIGEFEFGRGATRGTE